MAVFGCRDRQKETKKQEMDLHIERGFLVTVIPKQTVGRSGLNLASRVTVGRCFT